ncbi:hypothetical protein BOTBODRAFT_173211 [Botryobasidium botryosum FD-172 SS1]|uniref:Asteroid domain-containing protein n=1 Tax=Botryobasidium botryosum (strain FD-172 SS1) TaxID=930990 RepID=A0A067MNP6_BOTB1|nr:hypothetical protein BOTBODRAFT_173211 [Botryobasidium botryosum FD-172 SS1]
MGVRGLTKYAKDNRRSLSKPVQFTAQSEPQPIVVDGWSFIYYLLDHGGLPWVYGGEYEAYAQLVQTVVKAWLKVNLKPHFVFDGASSFLKQPEIIARRTSSIITPGNLFFRTSPTSRTTPRFLAENRIKPPLLYSATVSALLDLQPDVRCTFAEREGDPYCVALAALEGALVASLDSDFLVLSAYGYAGYVPLDEMVWTESPEEDPAAAQANGDDGEWVVATKRSGRSRGPGNGGFIPPDSFDTLSVSVYHPDVLANHLRLSPGFLPLLGALVGNDYTPAKLSWLFFERSTQPAQRILRCASVLREAMAPTSLKRRKKVKEADGERDAMGLINRVVSELSLRTLDARDQEEAVEKVVNAVLEYAVPDPSPLGPFAYLLPQPNEHVVEAYAQAYAAGKLSPQIMDILFTGSMWPTLGLEDPDLESCPRSIGSEIRQWMYAVLADGLVDCVGLPEGDEADEGTVSELEGSSRSGVEDEDELVDVVEEHTDDDEGEFAPTTGDSIQEDLTEDPLAGLKTALEKLRLQDAALGASPFALVDESQSDAAQPSPPVQEQITPIRSPTPPALPLPVRKASPRYVTEYVRRGTRLAPSSVLVVPLSSLMDDSEPVSPTSSTSTEPLAPIPIQLRAPEARLDIFLIALESDTQSVRDVHPSWIMMVTALRWVVRTTFAFGRDAVHRWMQSEARALIRSCVEVTLGDHPLTEEAPAPAPITEVSTRAVQLTAQVLASLEACEHLAQVLLITDRVPACARKFSGRAFHAALLRLEAEPDAALSNGVEEPEFVEELMRAVGEGLDECWREEKSKSGKKAKRKAKREQARLAQTAPGKKTAFGMYSALAEMGA